MPFSTIIYDRKYVALLMGAVTRKRPASILSQRQKNFVQGMCTCRPRLLHICTYLIITHNAMHALLFYRILHTTREGEHCPFDALFGVRPSV